MLTVLANRTYLHLFSAQVLALLGTGLLTVALGLLAFDLAGEDAGLVLGTALAIKMIAYVGVAPIATALAERLPRKALLVGLDLVRAAIALALPFVSEVWQIYVLIFVLQAASAAFTPTFQAIIPDILTEERDYTRALSLSRLAYDLEALASPLLAAALLTLIGYHDLFAGTVVGFLASAALVVTAVLPAANPREQRPFLERATHGVRIFLATPRLRALMAFNIAVAAAGAMVIVNSVVIVQGVLGFGQQETALALAAFGGGSVVAALLLPRILDAVADRPVLLAGGVLAAAGLFCGAVIASYGALLAVWLVLGVGYSLLQVPVGRLIRRSAHPEDRPAVFAGQFTLSHAAWLVTYPLAGWLGALLGIPAAFIALGLVSASGVALAAWLWPVGLRDEIAHTHSALPEDHPHLRDVPHGPGHTHVHAVVIDRHHRSWPVAAEGRIHDYD